MNYYTATYSPEDNKLRLSAVSRLDKETYARVKAAGFSWAPKQEIFVAPMWTPEREDLCIELAGEIEDEDKSLVERAEDRADRTKPEKGGACRCWASVRGGWSYIQKVNQVSVTVLDSWGNGSGTFTRTIPFDKLSKLMTAAEVQEARDTEQLVEMGDKTGFVLRGEVTGQPRAPKAPEATDADFEKIRESLKAGVQVVSAPQLFPTPAELAARMVELADIHPADRILEPSAGSGNILHAMRVADWLNPNDSTGQVVAIELNAGLADQLARRYSGVRVRQANFLECNAESLGGKFDRILMNPPFQNGADIKHIQHALTLLNKGGRLVAICANGPRQREGLEPLADSWEDLPAGTFKEAGTGVNTALLIFDGQPTAELAKRLRSRATA